LGNHIGVASVCLGLIEYINLSGEQATVGIRATDNHIYLHPLHAKDNQMAAGDNSKKALADALNGLLADYYVLYLKTKNFHWHVTGPHFHDYHLLFDTHAAELIATTDMVAERVRKLGQSTLTSIGSIAAKQTLADNDAKTVGADKMLAELHADNETLIVQLKAAKELAEDAGDNATDGLLDDWTDQAEQRTWFLAATMGKA
jgi:starvation-inducible DNA-binding protein